MGRNFSECPHCYGTDGHSLFKCGKCSREWCSECNPQGAFGSCPSCGNSDTDNINNIGHIVDED